MFKGIKKSIYKFVNLIYSNNSCKCNSIAGRLDRYATPLLGIYLKYDTTPCETNPLCQKLPNINRHISSIGVFMLNDVLRIWMHICTA